MYPCIAVWYLHVAVCPYSIDRHRLYMYVYVIINMGKKFVKAGGDKIKHFLQVKISSYKVITVEYIYCKSEGEHIMCHKVAIMQTLGDTILPRTRTRTFLSTNLLICRSCGVISPPPCSPNRWSTNRLDLERLLYSWSNVFFRYINAH